MQLYTVESLSGRRIKEGELVYASTVLAANLLRDAREAITNAIGGKMRRYERLLDRVTAQALDILKECSTGQQSTSIATNASESQNHGHLTRAMLL